MAWELLGLLDSDGYGVTDDLLAVSGPALGPQGRAELRRLLEARLAGQLDPSRQDDFGDARGRFATSLRLRELADLEGDVDAFISRRGRGRARILPGDITQRLTAAGRAPRL